MAFGPETTEANKRLVVGKWVWLQRDRRNHNHYQRLLRYVFLEDGRMSNAVLVVKWGTPGFLDARAKTYRPDTLFECYFRGLQRRATRKRSGTWRTR